MQEQYWLTKVSLNFSPKTGRTIIFTLQLRVIKHRVIFRKSLSSLSKKRQRDCKILQQKKVVIIAKADLIFRFSPSLGPFEAILLFLIWKKGKPFLSLLKFFPALWRTGVCRCDGNVDQSQDTDQLKFNAVISVFARIVKGRNSHRTNVSTTVCRKARRNLNGLGLRFSLG